MLALVLSLSFFASHLAAAQATQPPKSLNVLSTPWSGGAAADFDGDGNLDYVSNCPPDPPRTIDINALRTYFGRGDGLPIRPALGNLNPFCAAGHPSGAGDLNSDGKADYVVINGSLLYALGNGDGTFVNFLSVPIPANFNFENPTGAPPSVLIGDFNGDGRPDIYISDMTQESAFYLANDSGGFAAAVVNTYASALTAAPFLADVNGDGLSDILAPTKDGLIVNLGSKTSTFPSTPGIVSSDALRYAPYLVDPTGTGKKGIMAFDPTTETVSFYRLASDGSFCAPVTEFVWTPPQDERPDVEIAFTDLDGDGKTDLVLEDVFLQNSNDPNSAENLFIWAKGKGDGTFQQQDDLIRGYLGEASPLLQPVTLGRVPAPAFLDNIGNIFLPTPSTSGISINRAWLEFGSTIGSYDVQIKSVGTDDLIFTSSQTASPFKSTATCPSPVSNDLDTVCFVSLGMNTLGPARYQGNLSIASNATAAPLQLPIFVTVGPATPPEGIQGSPIPLDFGSQPLDSVTTLPLTLGYANGNPTVVSISAFTGPPFFSLTKSTCPATPVTTCVVSVTFHPTEAGNYGGTLSVRGSNLTLENIPLTGTVPSPTTFILSPPALTFGSTEVGKVSAIQTVTITNTTNDNVESTDITASAGFAIVGDTCPTNIVVQTSCIISVRFEPTVAGPQTGKVTIQSAAPDSPQTVQLTGTAAAVSAPALTVTPSTLNFTTFGETPSTPQSVTLANTGNLALQIQSVNVPDGFSVLNACGSTLAAGSSCELAVTYTPSDTAPTTGALTITDNAANSPQTVSLAVNPTGLTLAAAPDSSTSASISTGQTATYHMLATSQGGYAGTLTATCTGAPAGMQCVATPATVTVASGKSSDVTFTVSPSTTAAIPLAYRISGTAMLAALFGLFGQSFRKRGIQLRRLALVFAVVSILFGSIGCAGSIGLTSPGTAYALNAVLTNPAGQQVQQTLVLTVTTGTPRGQ